MSADGDSVQRTRWTAGVRAQLLWLVLLVTLPLLAASSLRFWVRVKTARAAVERDVENTARLVAARVEERVHAADAMITGLTTNIRMDSLQQAYNDRIFAATLKLAPTRYANIFGFQANGARVGLAVHRAAIDTVRGTQREYFRDAMRSGGFAVGAPRRSMVTPDSALIVSMARAVLDSARQPIGVIGVSLRIDSLSDLVQVRLSLPPNSVISILDSGGTILARSTNGRTDVARNAAPAVARPPAPHPQESGTAVIKGLDGIRRLTSYARPRDTPWRVYVGIPLDEALGPLRSDLQQDIAASVGALAVAIFAALLLGGRIARPLAALTNDARAIAQGAAGHRTLVQEKSEIGVLAQSFNLMAETVERRNAALADSERRYRLLFDSNPLPMYAWDAETLHILASNEAAQERYGYTREQFLQLRITDLLDPAEMSRFDRAGIEFREERQDAGIWMHRTASGAIVEMEVITTSSRRLGRASWLSVCIDVTARRAAERALALSEEALRQSQKMEAIGAFAGGIAHDFNNLLTGILGYCELALGSIHGAPSVRDDVEEVKALALRGAELTRQILTVSRRQILQPTVLDINAVVGNLDRLLRRLIGEHITLRTDLVGDIGFVRADAGQLEQVLLNLTANARDAMPAGGTITIRTHVASPEDAAANGLAPGAWVALCVKDTGAGMSDEVRERIFEPFFTTKERGKGTGLGLALVYAMVEQSGGRIRVVSAPGKGSTFHLFFPQVRESAAAHVTEPRVALPLDGTETVLLAEDEASVRAVATAALERHGYRVLAAPDGPSALALARAHAGPIHLLLTDVVMPHMNGRELAEQLSVLRPDTKVLYASGYTDDAILLHGVRVDELPFLQKPFTPQQLVERVREVLHS